MRLRSSNKPLNGARRTIKKFLWFPKSINNEIRWLEKAVWTECCIYYGNEHTGYVWWEWKAEKWINT